MVAKARPKYEPIGDDLNFEVAFLQAAAALDLAAILAVESRDAERLESIGGHWIAMADRLMPNRHAQDDDEEEEQTADKNPIGFKPPVVIEVDELENENGEPDG